jgi:MSHA pilin protein MshC
MIMGILAIVAMPKFADRQGFDARAYADQSASMFRYAQKLAIAQQRQVFVRLNGSSIALCFNNACSTGNLVPAPSGTGSGACTGSGLTPTELASWFCEAPHSSVAYSVSPATAMFYFDSLGKPFDTSNTALAAPITLTVSGGGVSRSFTMERETGYVH